MYTEKATFDREPSQTHLHIKDLTHGTGETALRRLGSAFHEHDQRVLLDSLGSGLARSDRPVCLFARDHVDGATTHAVDELASLGGQSTTLSEDDRRPRDLRWGERSLNLG